jgi:hypothetical protein
MARRILMKITLSLYEDPYGDDEPIGVKANMWVMYVNGELFPSTANGPMTLKRAEEVTQKLLEIDALDFDSDLF